jgi:hypothetical protein
VLVQPACPALCDQVAQVVAHLGEDAPAGDVVAPEPSIQLGEERLDGAVRHDALPSTPLMPRAKAFHASRSLDSAFSPAGVSE